MISREELLKLCASADSADEYSGPRLLRRLVKEVREFLREGDMDSRQKQVYTWALENFGPIAANRDERAVRLFEEAVEIAQVEKISMQMLIKIISHVYARPVGVLGQEVGGTFITLLALAQNAGLSVAEESDKEWNRVLSKSKEWWEQKHARKIEAGIANLSSLRNHD